MEEKTRDARIVKISTCIHKMYDSGYFNPKEICKEYNTSPLLITLLAKFGHITATKVGSTNQPVESGTYVWSGLNPLENLSYFSTGLLEHMLDYERQANERRRMKRHKVKEKNSQQELFQTERLLTVDDAVTIAKAVKKWNINEIELFVKYYVKEHV